MKVSLFSAVRAIAVLVIGFLLITYREQMMTWLAVTIGALFFISGLISCLGFYYEKDKIGRTTTKSPDVQEKSKASMFPLTALGSMCIGIALMLMPNTFITWIVYILAALFGVGAINQYVDLSSSRQYARVPFYYWLFPAITLVIAAMVIAKPMQAASLPLLVVGWLAVFYGVIELTILLRLIRVKRQFERENPIVTATPIEENQPQT